MNNRSASWRRKPDEAAANSWRQEDDFGNAESIGGVAGDSSIGISEIIGANHSTTGDGSTVTNPKRNFAKSDASYYENDSVMLWSDDPEKEYFKYMLQREQENRARKGKSAEDSLIGDSTLEEIQQEFSKWHQHGGQIDPEPEQDPNSSFPILSSSHKSSPHRATLDGFSLATDEKSPPKQTPVELDLPPTPSSAGSNNNKLFPDVIYVTDTPATSIAMSKPSQDSNSTSASARRRSNCIFFAFFFLGGICLSAAAVAIYMSVSSKKANDTNTASSLQDSNNELISVNPQGSSFKPTVSPSLRPSVLDQATTSAPTSSIGEQDPKPTLRPTTIATTGTTKETTILPTELPTPNPSAAASGSPTIPPADIPTSHPTTQPTEAPSNGASATPPKFHCGCEYCGFAIERMAEGYSCGDRMNFLIFERGYSELGACRLVAGVEFPSICGPFCDPDRCEVDTAASAAAPIQPLRRTQKPTSNPTSDGTTSPYAALVLRGNNGMPKSAYPLGQCEGDCDNDDDCGPGLVCFQRDSGDPVPGCYFGSQSLSQSDFCMLEDHLARRNNLGDDDFFPSLQKVVARTSEPP